MERKSRLLWIALIAALALIPRIFLALGRTDLFWPDEHFQTLEPASKWVNGYGLLAWEWHDGFRTWLIPGLYSIPFWILHWIGIQDGAIWILVVRTLQSLLSSTAVLSNFLSVQFLAQRLHFRREWAWFAAILTAGSTTLVQWSPATLTETIALAFMPAAIAFVLKKPESKWAGAALFLPSMIRVQCGLWSAGTLALFLLFFQKPARWKWSALTAALPMFLVGVVDWVTWGKPFYSWYQQLTRGAKVSEFYGVSPWWNGFEQLFEAAGPWLLFLALLALIIFGILLIKNRSRDEFQVIALLMIPTLIFWGVHFCLAHKEARFFMPPIGLIPVWISVAAAIALSSKGFDKKLGELASEFLRPQLLIPLALLAVFGNSITLQYAHFPLEQVNTLWLERKIAKMPSVHSGSCILEIGHDWSWSRGYLVTGKEVDWKSKELKNLSDAEMNSCPVALVFEGQENGFATRSSWERVAKIGSYSLFKNPGLN